METIIIGRSEEQNELMDIYKSPRAELVAVFGRRRVGKTYLINSFFKLHKCTFFQAIGLRKGSMRKQLQNFTESISETFYNKAPLQEATTWSDAFKLLTTNIELSRKHDKVVLFLDELPWMATARSGFLDAFDYYWNKYWSHIVNLKVIICGSSASWIINKIINDTGGLHNRVTRQIFLRPFLLYEVKEYLKYIKLNLNDNQILEIYMALGGIPFYLNNLKRNLSVTQNINLLCFKLNGLLYNEFDKLFDSLFKEAEAYKEIVRIIASKFYGIERTDLDMKCRLSSNGGTLTERLKALEDSGFIISFIPYGHKTKGLCYRLIDEYSLFYLQWVEYYKTVALKVNANDDFWSGIYNTPAWSSWSGYAFEAVCYKHIDLIRQALKIRGGVASSWRYSPVNKEENGAQIDLLFDRYDDAITVCEIKYTSQPFLIDKAYAKKLLEKCAVFKRVTRTNKQIFIALVSANGLKDNIYADDLVTTVVNIGDLIKTPR